GFQGAASGVLRMGVSTSAVSRIAARLALTIAIVGLVTLALGASIYLGAALRIVRPLRQAAGVLAAVAEGDFTRHIEAGAGDEVGQMAGAVHRRGDRRRATPSEVYRAAASVTGVSGQMSASADSMASGAQQQAASLEETAATIEELTSTVKQNADNARQASQLAIASRETAEKG